MAKEDHDDLRSKTPVASKEEPSTQNSAPKVYQAICNVMQEIADQGIGKNRKASSPGANYAFRGIDDVYNALCSILWKHKLCMLPSATERACEERLSKSGGALFYVTLKVNFALVSAEDGSSHYITTYGEAMDSGDKATNKAQSAAYKYAAMMAFCIPTEGTGKDSEEDTYTDVAPRAVSQPSAAKASAPETGPAKPPHNSATGEILPPHAIDVPLTNGVGDPDRWAEIYMAALIASPEKVEEWVKLNAKLMSQLASYSPTSHKKVSAVLDKIRGAQDANPIAAG